MSKICDSDNNSSYMQLSATRYMLEIYERPASLALMERSGIDIRVQGMVGNLFDPITVVLRIPAEMSNCRDKDFLLLTHV